MTNDEKIRPVVISTPTLHGPKDDKSAGCAADSGVALSKSGFQWTLVIDGQETIMCACGHAARALAERKGLTRRGNDASVLWFVCRTYFEGGPLATHRWVRGLPFAADPENPDGSLVTIEHMFISREAMDRFSAAGLGDNQRLWNNHHN